MQNKIKIFDTFLAQLSTTYRNYCVWVALQNKKYNPAYNMNSYFWGAVLDSGITAFSIELSKLVEDDSKNDNLSIFSLIRIKLEDLADVLSKMKKARNKNWAHFDMRVILNQEDFYQKLGLKWGELDKLFLKLFEILKNIKHHFRKNDSTDYLERADGIKKNCEREVKFIVERVKNSKSI